MKIADKACYPLFGKHNGQVYVDYGLTFRERLIIALASNPMMKVITDTTYAMDAKHSFTGTAKMIIKQADAIIEIMEKQELAQANRELEGSDGK